MPLFLLPLYHFLSLEASDYYNDRKTFHDAKKGLTLHKVNGLEDSLIEIILFYLVYSRPYEATEVLCSIVLGLLLFLHFIGKCSVTHAFILVAHCMLQNYMQKAF